MITGNRVISAGLAMVDGRETGLAGCSVSHRCNRAGTCLRADPQLTAVRAEPPAGAACPIFIPAGASQK